MIIKTKLQDKLSLINEMANEINARKDLLISHSVKAQLSEEKDRLEFKLKEMDKEFNEKVKELTQFYAEKEADIKIASFTKAWNLIKDVPIFAKK